MSWYVTNIIIYLLGIAAILASTLWANHNGSNRRNTLDTLEDKDSKVLTGDSMTVKHNVSLAGKTISPFVFEQGGYGLGDNFMGLISLYYLLRVVPSLRGRKVQFLFQWPLFRFFENPSNVEILNQRPIPPPETIMNITHLYFGEYPAEFSYEKLSGEYRQRMTKSEYWPDTPLIMHCNMPLFAFDLDGKGMETLAKQVFQDWLKPRKSFKEKIQTISNDIHVLYHIRIGDAQLVHDYDVRTDSIKTMLSGVTQLNVPDHSIIFLATDTRECLSVARQSFPQYVWKGWEDYYEAVQLQHLTFLDQDKNNDPVMERTLVEFMLFKSVPTVVTQRWSNFSKIGLLANDHPELKIWLLENRDSHVLREVTDKKDLIFK